MATETPGCELRGEVVYLYAFDVANEIQLDRAAVLLSGRAAPFVARPDRPTPRSVPISRPLAVEPPTATTRVNGEVGRILVRAYDIGVVSVTIRVSFTRDSLTAVVPFHTPTLDDGRPLDVLARQQCDEVRGAMGDALVQPGEATEPEAYTVFAFTSLGGDTDANQWLTDRQREIAGLLTETPGERLSESQVTEVLRLRRSFEKSDLVVIDWDAALVVELNGYADDVLFVLELANLQLEEFRWMDRSLDRYLERAYVDLSRPRWWAFGAAVGVLSSLRRLRIDLTKLADEVTHITKFVGDWHLARVYILARERFHLDQWRNSVEQRLGQLDHLYTITRGDLYDRRMLTLEIVIVIFFAIDLVMLFLK
ncbi:MAG: hypothetical protein C0467_21295 [Planctomycetaceae bacterium]|nr:hypothetical protein [Planctomycetaceae bacterium]